MGNEKMTSGDLINNINNKRGVAGGWPKCFSYGLENEIATVEMASDFSKKEYRRLDSWGMAYFDEIEKNLGSVVKIIRFVVGGKGRQINKPDFQAFFRRVSYLNINNPALQFEIEVNGSFIPLLNSPELFARPQNEMTRTDYNYPTSKNDPGRLEKDFQSWLFADELLNKGETGTNTNERLAILGFDFYNIKRHKVTLAREFPTGVFDGSVEKRNRILPTEYVDLVTLNKFGVLSVVELKLNDTQLEVIAQLLDYVLFFKCYYSQLKEPLKTRYGIFPKVGGIVGYVANNLYHPRFDGVFRFYRTNNDTVEGLELKKITLGHTSPGPK